MLSKLVEFIRQNDLIRPGDEVVCAVSGGADSVALLFALYLLRDRMDFTLSAAHFNHGLRGEESDGDQAFVERFCDRYEIPLHVGSGRVIPGEKGLEAAARDARYTFLRSLPGKIATAHTADDNAETVLLHLIRGTGLKGLGAIAPVNGRIIRPMLTVTRQDVEDFLEEYYLPHVEDSSNGGDDFLRNRIRHHVMPLLRRENPRLAENMSALALKLRRDEAFIASNMGQEMPTVPALRDMDPALRSRYLERFLKESGIPEPEERHIALSEELVFSDKPSARGNFPGGVVIGRNYDRLEVVPCTGARPVMSLEPGSCLELEDLQLRICCDRADGRVFTRDAFTVVPAGRIVLRSREAGDVIRLSGGTKKLKKLFIDAHIPAARREQIPVLADDRGILGVYGFGADLDRIGDGDNAVTIRFEAINKTECLE